MNFAMFLPNFHKILSEFHEKFQKSTIFKRDFDKGETRKMPEISGYAESSIISERNFNCLLDLDAAFRPGRRPGDRVPERLSARAAGGGHGGAGRVRRPRPRLENMFAQKSVLSEFFRNPEI